MPGTACAACGKRQEGLILTLGQGLLEGSLALCKECAERVASLIQKLCRNQHFSLPPHELTSELVSNFSEYSRNDLLDELIMETTRYFIGPLEADERRVAMALMERLATLGIARKVHREGCEIWPEYRLCKCPWEVPA